MFVTNTDSISHYVRRMGLDYTRIVTDSLYFLTDCTVESFHDSNVLSDVYGFTTDSPVGMIVHASPRHRLRKHVVYAYDAKRDILCRVECA
jgi:hypothetical protein